MRAGLAWVIVSVLVPLAVRFVGPLASYLFERTYLMPASTYSPVRMAGCSLGHCSSPGTTGPGANILLWLGRYNAEVMFWMSLIPCLVTLGIGLLVITRQSRKAPQSA